MCHVHVHMLHMYMYMSHVRVCVCPCYLTHVATTYYMYVQFAALRAARCAPGETGRGRGYRGGAAAHTHGGGYLLYYLDQVSSKYGGSVRWADNRKDPRNT